MAENKKDPFWMVPAALLIVLSGAGTLAFVWVVAIMPYYRLGGWTMIGGAPNKRQSSIFRYESYEKLREAWRSASPEHAELLDRVLAKEAPADLDASLPVFEPGSMATRVAPRGPGTMTSRRLPRSISAKIRPSWRMIARSAKPPDQPSPTGTVATGPTAAPQD